MDIKTHPHIVPTQAPAETAILSRMLVGVMACVVCSMPPFLFAEGGIELRGPRRSLAGIGYHRNADDAAFVLGTCGGGPVALRTRTP
jgi:hypothetical protein